VFFCVFLWPFFSVVLRPQEQQQPLFRATIDAVRVDTLVMDGRTPILGLTADDFELRDNGVLQHIDAVQFGDVPLSVTLVLDVSASVDGQPLAHLKDAAGAAIRALAPDDRAALLTFSQRLWLDAPFTIDRTRLQLAVERVAARGSTNLYDAAYTALMLRDPQAVRSLVLVFSDGRDTSSWLPASAVLEIAKTSDAVVYAVSLGSPEPITDPWHDASARLPLGLHDDVSPTQFLHTLADDTGGADFMTSRSADLANRFVEIVKEFKSRYLLTYAPIGVEPSGWHTIEVKLKGRRGKVTARRGYQR
jgi:VWFA-related protein